MMNVLTDILCDTSSTMAPQNFKGTLPQNKTSHHDIPSKQGHLHLFDSISQMPSMDRPISSVNHSSPNINIFHSSSQIHIPSNIDSGFEERNGASVFSDAFPEIVPSWLAHDFMKVSDNLPSPGILSNVSDIYSTNRENEHLEMLDLGFPSELTTQDVVPNNLNRTCIDESQKLLADLPMQRFSNNDSLIIPAFNDINNTHLNISINKNNMQYSKFKQNEHQMNSTRSLMNTVNTVLPCENELLHLPLPSNLTDQCLNSTSSPSIMSNSQSQSHPVDVVCDKLPQINLNHLDSLLGSETSLSEIQLLRHDFPNVRLAEDNCNSHSNRECLENYNPSENVMPCDAGNILASAMLPSLRQFQDASVQVSVNVSARNNLLASENCFSCKEVSVESPIEITQCFKCKFCDYISIHKCAVSNHINVSHSKSSDATDINKGTHNGSDNLSSLSVQNKNEIFHQTNPLINSNNLRPVLNNMNSTTLISERNIDKYSCLHCSCSFFNINEYNSHLLANHNKPDKNHNHIQSLASGTSVGYQLISVNGMLNTSAEKFSNENGNFVISNISNLLQNDASKSSNGKIYPKKINNTQDMNHSETLSSEQTMLNNQQNVSINQNASQKKVELNKNISKNCLKKTDETQRKNQSKKSATEPTTVSSEKKLSAHKKAWQRKMKRELGSYICEFKGCNIRFRALDNLEYHRKCHSVGGSAFACPECGTTFENWGAIAGHLWRNHNNDMELHACDQCPFRTYSLSRLENIHKRIHKDECLFLCDTCGKSFKNAKQLRNHRVTHNKTSKPKPVRSDIYKCNICLRGFAAKRILHFHLSSVHEHIKPFLCNYCEYTASKRSTMDLHMRQHTGEKPFKCDKCSYKTSDHNSLRRHKMTHTGKKPYKCPYCPYSCIQASPYKAHLKKHPGQNEGLIFSCKLCKFKTIKRDSYSLHMNEHASLNEQPRENSTVEMHSTDEIFPLAEAMDISLSQSDNLLSNFNKNKDLQSFFYGFNINMVSVGQENVN